MESKYLALLRGINVGGKNKVPMKDLVEVFAEAGCADIRTFIQSGNVVFSADSRLAESLSATLTSAIARRFGFDVPVVLRTTEEIQSVASNNPFLKAGASEDALHVLFLAGKPEAGRVEGLDSDRSRPGEFAVRGKEVYLYLPNGVARTKLTNSYFDSKLATISTGRNWKTVTRLLDLMMG